MKKLLYISCHITMECNELEFLSELGFECVTIGHYTKNLVSVAATDPLYWTMHDWRVPNFNRNEDLTNEFLDLNPYFNTISTAVPNLTKEFLSKFDVILVSNYVATLQSVLQKVSGNQLVIWCSVGQINPGSEAIVSLFKDRIVKVRTAPTEESMSNFAGVDYYTASSVDPKFFIDWSGEKEQVVTVSRAVRMRSSNVNLPILLEIGKNLPYKIYGKGNENLGQVQYNGGELTFSGLIGCYKSNRVFLNGGSAPAPLTYTFQEAMVVGIPIVCFGDILAKSLYGTHNLYNMDKYIENGITGFKSNNKAELTNYCNLLLKDSNLANQISKNAKEYARKVWCKDAIKETWRKIFEDKNIL